MRWADGELTGRLELGIRRRLGGVATVVGPVVGVLVAAALARQGGLSDNVGVSAAGGFAGLIAGVGVLYPIQ